MMMKKAAAMFLCAMLIFGVDACSAEKKENRTTAITPVQSTTNAYGVRQPSQEKLLEAFEAVGIENWDGSYKNLTFEQRTSLEQYFAKKWSEDVKFSDEGVRYVENTVPLKGSWAENKILKLAPDPKFDSILSSSVETDAVSVSYTNVTAEEIKRYTGEVKAAGFDKILEEYTSSCCGTVFRAQNEDGVTVSLSSKLIAQAVTTIVVSAAGETSTNQAGYKKISPKEAKALIDAGNVVILDVRTPDEYNESHIKGAVLLPNTEISEQAPTILPDKNAKILVYCRSGNRSASASKELITMGYADVLDFGGINDWPYETEN